VEAPSRRFDQVDGSRAVYVPVVPLLELELDEPPGQVVVGDRKHWLAGVSQQKMDAAGGAPQVAWQSESALHLSEQM
jgi:hypothetical protein